MTVEKFEWRKVLSVRSTPAGKGLFARKLFKKRQAIGHMQGTLIEGDDYDPDYVVDMGKFGVLDPKAPFRFLNHSCEPNCQLLEWESTKKAPPQIWVHAIKTVRPSDQLTIDYGWPADSAIPCLCGTASCRGWVVDQSELARVKNRAARRRRKNATASGFAPARVPLGSELTSAGGDVSPARVAPGARGRVHRRSGRAAAVFARTIGRREATSRERGPRRQLVSRERAVRARPGPLEGLVVLRRARSVVVGGAHSGLI